MDYITKQTKEEITNHPELRDKILSNFDSMVVKLESGENPDKCYANYVSYLDNYVRNQPVDSPLH